MLDDIKKVEIQHLKQFHLKVSSAYNIPILKIKKSWLERNQNGPSKNVLNMLKKLKVTEKIVKINNHYVHPPSGFVFDPISKKVIGKQVDGGEIKTLTENDILACRQWKFEHTIPLNLDAERETLKNELDALSD